MLQTQEFIKDLHNAPSDLSIIKQFLCMYYYAWIDSDHNLYVQQEYCQNGDLLDYLGILENEKASVLTEEFYWDLVFETICVS